MAVLDAMQSAALRLAGRKPAVFFGAPDSMVFEAEICDLVNEVATDVAHYRDWSALKKVWTIQTDGSESYPLPPDYDRMTIDATVSKAGWWLWGYFRYGDLDTFIIEKDRNMVLSPGGWTIYGEEMHFWPVPEGEAQFPYISSRYVRCNDTTQCKRRFTADQDEFLLPERLLTLGLVWRWREQKKLDYTGDQEAFVKALSEYASKDGGARSYASRRRNSFPGARLAYPYELG